MSDNQEPWVYIDPGGKFSFCVPHDWAVDPTGQRGACVFTFGPNIDDGFRANVNIVVQPLSPLTHDEYLTLSRLQIRKMGNLARLAVDEPALRFPGGRVLEWTALEASPPIRTRQLIAFAGPEVFVVTAMATAASLDRYEPLFQVMMDSFRCAGPVS